MPRADLILNPIAGAAERASALGRFRDELVRAGWTVVVRPTDHAGHASALARASAGSGADAVVAAGGDGTINEVARGLLAAGPAAPPLGLLPRGTSNLLAREFGVPADPAGAARVVAGGHTRALDVADVSGRPMICCAGVGWDARVVRELAARRTGHIRAWTWFGPIRAAARDYEFPVFRVTPDGGEPVECVYAMFMNCAPYARYFRPAPDARPDDGALDAVLIGPGGRDHLLRLAWRGWRGTMQADAAVRTIRAAAFDVASAGPVPLQIDGDDGGDAPVRISLRAGALRLLAPVPSSRLAPAPVGDASGGRQLQGSSVPRRRSPRGA